MHFSFRYRMKLFPQASLVTCILTVHHNYLETRTTQNASGQAVKNNKSQNNWRNSVPKGRKKKKKTGSNRVGKRAYFSQWWFRWPDNLGRCLWRDQENYCLVDGSSEISPMVLYSTTSVSSFSFNHLPGLYSPRFLTASKPCVAILSPHSLPYILCPN